MFAQTLTMKQANNLDLSFKNSNEPGSCWESPAEFPISNVYSESKFWFDDCCADRERDIRSAPSSPGGVKIISLTHKSKLEEK